MAKFFWDMAKVAFTLLVIGPFAKPESIGSIGLLIGIAIGLALVFMAHSFDGREVLK